MQFSEPIAPLPRPASVWPLAAGGLLLGLSAPALIRFLEFAGRMIPQEDMGHDWAVGVAWGLFLGALLLLAPVRAQDRSALAVLWVAKCAITLGFMLVYEARYALDAFVYYRAAVQPVYPWHEFRWAGTEIVEAGAWLHNRVVPDSYHAIKVSCAMIGLAAIYLFYRAAVRFRGVEDVRILYFLGLFPSIIFWSSILGKDPISLFGIAAYVYGVVSLQRTRRLRYGVVAAAGVVVAMMVRLWLGPILLLPLVVLGFRGVRGFFPRVAFTVVAVGGLGLATLVMAERFALESTRDVIAATSTFSQAWAEGGSAQQVTADLTSASGMAAFAPRGAFTALFRPLPGEVMNPFGLLAGLENLFLLGLLGLAVVRFRRASLRDPLVPWAIVLTLTWAIVYGFVSYQNLGAAVRFKLQILPLLLLLLWHLAWGVRGAAAVRRAPAAPALSGAEG